MTRLHDAATISRFRPSRHDRCRRCSRKALPVIRACGRFHPPRPIESPNLAKSRKGGHRGGYGEGCSSIELGRRLGCSRPGCPAGAAQADAGHLRRRRVDYQFGAAGPRVEIDDAQTSGGGASAEARARPTRRPRSTRNFGRCRMRAQREVVAVSSHRSPYFVGPEQFEEFRPAAASRPPICQGLGDARVRHGRRGTPVSTMLECGEEWHTELPASRELVFPMPIFWHCRRQAPWKRRTARAPSIVPLAIRARRARQPSVTVLPITHSPPADPASAVEIPLPVRRHLGSLDTDRS